MKTIKTVGVVGAGTMGSALAQKFAQEGFKVILADREMKYIDNGISGIKTILNQGVERRLFRPEQVENIVSNINGTTDLNELAGCDIIIEAIFENFDAKAELFKQLSGIVPAETILATNTSSFSVNDLAECVTHPERFIGLHYFFHAAKNRLVEIVPGKKTSEETLKAAQMFSVLSGKDAISCEDAYGFVVNRFFVPWLNESARLLEEGVASKGEIDTISLRTFRIGMGPFALMNATGIPVAYHSQKTLEVHGDFYETSNILKTQTDLNQQWEIEKVAADAISNETKTIVSERLLGAVFLACAQLLEEKVCKAVDINRGARIGLRWGKGPIELMQERGEEDVKRIITLMLVSLSTKLPESIKTELWKMEYVTLEKNSNIAVLRMDRPEGMNALNEAVMHELSDKFDEANQDSAIDTIYLTGSGKAFVAGADIRFFVKNIKSNSIDKIVSFTKYGQEVYDKIDHSPKKVVAILNGLTLGGGLELALCADVILALPKAVMAFPETGIGIYPGLGGTQRTAKRIGKGLSKYLVFTGNMLRAKDAEEMGLIDAVIQPDELFEILEGIKTIPASDKNQMESKWNKWNTFFENHSLDEIENSAFDESELSNEEIEKLRKKLHRKAPIALKISEKLIDDALGNDSELEQLNHIFSTNDALLGLSSIGKRVEFQGN